MYIVIFVSAFDNQQLQIVFTKTGVFVIFVCNHTLPLLCDYIVVVTGITRSVYLPFFLTIVTTWHSESFTFTKMIMDLENIINPNRLHFGNKSKKLQSTKEMNIVLKSGARGTKNGQL